MYALLITFNPSWMDGGRSVGGLWYGTIGSGLMVYAGLLSALRKVPAWWWIGSRKAWMRGHIWLGLLSFVFLLCHSNFRWGGVLEKVLWLTVGAVLLTGIYGLLLQQVLPRLMTTRVPAEAPYEQIPHLCQVMRRKADALVDAICGPYNLESPNLESTQAVIKLVEDSRAQLRTFYEHDVRPFRVRGSQRVRGSACCGDGEPQMAEVDPQANLQLDLSCPACGHRWQVLFDIGSFFWSELNAWAQRLLAEVHVLASAYGWREADILNLSPSRRQFYLGLISG